MNRLYSYIVRMWYSFYEGLDVSDGILYLGAYDYFRMIGTDEVFRFNSVLRGIYKVERILVYDERSKEIIGEYEWDVEIGRYRLTSNDIGI